MRTARWRRAILVGFTHRGLSSLVDFILGLFGGLVSLPIAVRGVPGRFGQWASKHREPNTRKLLWEPLPLLFLSFSVSMVAASASRSCWTTGRGPLGAWRRYTKAMRSGTRHQLLDDSYDRRDFFVDPGEFEFPDPPLPLAVGAAVVDLETGRKGRIQALPVSGQNWVKVRFPHDEESQSRRASSLRVIPEAQAAPSVVQPADITLLSSGITACACGRFASDP